MHKLYFSYLFIKYSKSLLIVLLGLTFTVTSIDYLDNASKIVGEGNQKILYAYYTWQYMLVEFYPLAIVFATTMTYLSLVKNNLMVSLFSFGYTKRVLFIPIFIPAFLLYISMQILQLGEFAYAKEKALSILHHTTTNRAVNNLFFKYNNSFVYAKRLDPIKRVLYEVTIFGVNKDRVMDATTIASVEYAGEYWVGKDAIQMTKHYLVDGTPNGFSTTILHDIQILHGYKPKVIEMIYEGESLSLSDAIATYRLLYRQNLDLTKIKSSIYNKSILPLFAFAVMVFIFFKTPYHSRYIKMDIVWAISLGGSILIWGLFYALYVLSKSAIVSPDFAMLLPIVILLGYSLFLYIGDKQKQI